jgi:hypothetical protein
LSRSSRSPGCTGVFRIAFNRWCEQAGEADLAQIIRESFGELKAVTAGQ